MPQMRMPTNRIPDDASMITNPEPAILDKLTSYLAAHPEVLKTDQCLACSERYPSGSLLCEACGKELTPSPSLRRAIRLVVNEMGILVMKPGSVFFEGDHIRLDGWQFDIRPWLRQQGIMIKAG